jgi:hypothetical protein
LKHRRTEKAITEANEYKFYTGDFKKFFKEIDQNFPSLGENARQSHYFRARDSSTPWSRAHEFYGKHELSSYVHNPIQGKVLEKWLK